MSAATTVPAGTYGLDPIHSTIGFGLTHNKMSTFRSTFESIEGQLADGVLTGAADVDSIAISEPNFKGHLMSPEFFDAAASPKLTFRSTAIKPSGDGSVEVDGELTIRGVTKPVTATGTFGVGKDGYGNERVAFGLSTTIDRRDFGITFENELPDGGVGVAFEVTITVDLELVKA